MQISEITRRDILDELRIRNIRWSGRLDEVTFLNRLYPLDSLPSTDTRFKNMAADIVQHRVNNYDWDDWWVLEDTRLELATNDGRFLDFLVGMLHPAVRSDEAEVATLLEAFNGRLIHDGWKIVEKERVSGRPVYVAISTGAEVQVQRSERIGSDYALSLLKKCEGKIGSGDFDGAISAARSLVETVLSEIYKRTSGGTLKGGALMEVYKALEPLLNLSADKFTNEAIKSTLRGLVSVISGLDTMSNNMGDRHTRPVQPQRHHAQLCVNCAKTIVDFLYDTLEYRFRDKGNIYEQLITALDSNLRLLPKDELMRQKEISQIYAHTDPNIRNLLKKQLIDEYSINSYRQSDIFFAALRVLENEIRKEDVTKIFKSLKDNNQACGLVIFLQETKRVNPEFISTEMRNLCEVDEE